MTAFILPAVIDALVAALQPLKASGVFVLDGPLPQWPKSDAVVIGVGQNESASEELERDMRAGGPVGYRDTVNVICSAYSWAEITDPTPDDIKDRRDVATGLVESVRAALEADPTLGGACLRADIGLNASMVATNDGEGATVSIGFSVIARRTV